MTAASDKVVQYSLFLLIAGIVFWVWGLILVVGGTTDSGVVLFLLPISAGLLGLYLTDKLCVKPVVTKLKVQIHVILVVLSHVLVTIVYIVAAAAADSFDKDLGFILYCIAAAVAWTVTGYFFIRAARAYQAEQDAKWTVFT